MSSSSEEERQDPNLNGSFINSIKERQEKTITPKVENEWKVPTVDTVKKGYYDGIMIEIDRVRTTFGKVRPEMLAVWGFTDTGKSTFMINYIEALVDLSENPKFMFRVVAPTNGSWKMILQEILKEGYNEYVSDSKKENRLEGLISDKINSAGTQVIFIDECNQLYRDEDPYGKTKRMADILKGVRNLSHKSGVIFILVGTPNLLKFLAKDPETNNRFKKIEFPRLELTEGGYPLFQLVLATFDKSISKKYSIKCSIATSKTKIKMIAKASFGKIGVLVKIYKTIGIEAYENNIETITLKFLDKIVKKLSKDGTIKDEDQPSLKIDHTFFNSLNAKR